MPPKYITYHDYAGFLVRGTVPIVIDPSEPLHMNTAAVLTAQMEAGNWGTVQSYDGAGMSAGLLHNIAVQPRDLAQGSLWQLLAAIRDAGMIPPLQDILNKLRERGFVLAEDGKLRSAHSGVLVDGNQIRAMLNGDAMGRTPPGSTHASHVDAKHWAEKFHVLFSDSRTYKAQIRYAVRWLCQGRASEELAVYKRFVGDRLDSPVALRRVDLRPDIDLAMCVYHSFSTNGPTPAATILRNTLASATDETFARKLIRAFGLSDFGRWHDDPDDKGGRYDHTRKAVEKSGLWPKALVADLMPRNL